MTSVILQPITHAITLTQPWATLMAMGAKRIETRGRRTNYRGWIAIHSAKAFPQECQWLCFQDPFRRTLQCLPVQLPLGVVLAVVRVVDCQPTETLVRAARGAYGDERVFGNYDPGRWGYMTTDVRQLREPIPMRGSQTIPWRMPRPITEEDLL